MVTSFRDVRYNVPRSSLPVDEQQRMQQYNQMLSGRNIQQSSMSVPGALSGADRGVRMLPGGNGMGMMCGMSRGMPISRPGFQGMASSPMLNSGSMLSSSMVGMPSPVNMLSGAGPGQVNSMLRPREALHMIRVSFIYYFFLCCGCWVWMASFSFGCWLLFFCVCACIHSKIKINCREKN